jgi:hypothetical protein
MTTFAGNALNTFHGSARTTERFLAYSTPGINRKQLRSAQNPFDRAKNDQLLWKFNRKIRVEFKFLLD